MTEFLQKKNSWRTSQESSQTRDYPEPEDSRRVLFGDFTEEEVLDYSTDTEHPHHQHQEEVVPEMIGGVSMEIIHNLDFQAMNRALERLKKEGVKESLGRLREDIWVLRDLAAGIVDSKMTDGERRDAVSRVVDAVLRDEEDEESDCGLTEEELAEVARKIDEDSGDPGLAVSKEREADDGRMVASDGSEDESSGDGGLSMGDGTKVHGGQEMEGESDGDGGEMEDDSGDSGDPDIRELPSPMEDASDAESVYYDALDVEPYDPILEY